MRSPSTCRSWSRPAGIADIERHRHRRRHQRRGRRAEGRRRRHRGPAGPRGCGAPTARTHRRPTRPPTSARSSPASTTTSTRSSPATPTWRTTARSRCAGWAGRAVTERPVVSAGQYGTNLNQLVFTSTRHRRGVGQAQAILALKVADALAPPDYPPDPARRPGDRGRRGGERRGAGCQSARRDRRAVQPGEARRRHHREPRWRVDPGQPGGRGAAVGHPRRRSRVGADRLHEPRRSARRTWSGTGAAGVPTRGR